MPPSLSTLLRNPHPLPADGLHRGDRLPPALKSDFVGVDERDTAAWLHFVTRMASRVRYTDGTLNASGNWGSFYRRQPAALTAALLSWPVNRLANLLHQHRALIEDNDISEVACRQLLDALFRLVFSTAAGIDEVARALPPSSPLLGRVQALVSTQLDPALSRWSAYRQAADDAGLLDANRSDYPLADERHPFGFPILAGSDLTLSSIWASNAGGLVTGEEAVFGPPAGVRDRIRHAVGHANFFGVYDTFISVISYLAGLAQTEWERLTTTAADHAPHVALLLSYLEVREAQRNMLNGLPERHLDFYYRRCLHLSPAPASAPKAFLHLEARPGLPPAFLPEGTVFRGSKDPITKAERLFQSTSALSVGHTSIASLRALYRTAVDGSSAGGRLYAATAVNTSDGIEAELPEGDTSWRPFGYRKILGGVTEVGMPTARLGFALSSNYLYLKEGTRTILLNLYTIGGQRITGARFKVSLTTEEGWWEDTITAEAGEKLNIALSATDPAILPYNEDVHGMGLDTVHPVLKVELMHEDGQAYAAHDYRGTRIFFASLTVTASGMRGVSLSGSVGVIDGSKPFFPFGATPRGGEVLHIGSREIFQKRAAIDLNIGWTNDNPGNKIMYLDTLRAGSWASAGDAHTLSGQTDTVSVSLANSDVIPPNYDDDNVLETSNTGGYLRWKLREGWGHAEYPVKLAKFLADTPAGSENPGELFTPELSELTVDYTASIYLTGSRMTTGNNHRLFHLTPFGHRKNIAGSSMPYLLPRVLPANEPAADKGALLIGVKDWAPGTQLKLLLNVAPGTASPLVDKPDNHLIWEYLNDNQWTAFPNGKFTDGTEGLLRSGIVSMELPSGVVADNTHFTDAPDLLWVRASVASATDAVNELTGIYPHAVEVVQDLSGDFEVTDEALPPGTIAKILEPRPAVKKVHQPYPTFHGAAPEDQSAYFTRQSERLRHKERAIMEWDVEHLVVEHVSGVERIICLQHLHFEPNAEAEGGYVYRELAAGHLTVLPLAANPGNPLLPFVSLTTREDIEAILRARLSCHAKLHVRNPLLEEVKVEAFVRYVPGTVEAWADTQIQRDLIDFLSPWTKSGLDDLDFSGTVNRSQVVNFLEELSYVDIVKDLKLKHLADSDQNDAETLRPTNLVAVLVAAPSHKITVLPFAMSTATGEVCDPVRRHPPAGSRVTFIANPEG